MQEVGGQEVRLVGKDFPTAFNLILCYFALGDRDKMKKGFIRILGLRLETGSDDERYLNLHVCA